MNRVLFSRIWDVRLADVEKIVPRTFVKITSNIMLVLDDGASNNNLSQAILNEVPNLDDVRYLLQQGSIVVALRSKKRTRKAMHCKRVDKRNLSDMAHRYLI
jgi:hypothetical protein